MSDKKSNFTYMNKNKLYLFLLFACFVGYSWLLFSLQHEHEIKSQEFTVCLFKKVTTVPCPSCGTTRSVMQLSHGNFLSAILINPFGIIVGLIMLVAPVWIGYDFIKKELSKEHKDGKTVVVTHFSPLMDSASSKYGINECQSYWCNHIPELVQQADFWIHGHVHRPQIYMEGQCKVICNPRGYSEFSGLAQESTFLPTYKFEV